MGFQDPPPTSTGPSPTPAPTMGNAPRPPAPPTPPVAKPYDNLVTYQDQARSLYQQKPGETQTHCNQASYWIGKQMDAPLSDLGNSAGVPYTANQMYQNLIVSQNYHEVPGEVAQNHANQGGFALALSYNPKGHGHAVTVRPQGVSGDTPYGNTGPLVNDIGKNDRVSHQSGAFGNHDHVLYFIPQTKGAR